MMVCGGAWIVVSRIEGAKLLSIQSDSMQPVLNKGDLVIETKIDPQKLQAGEVISYRSTQHPGLVITHRIIKTDYTRRYLVTKGDNLKTPDPPVLFESVVGKSYKNIPKLGYVFDTVRKPVGLVVFVYVPALIITLSELWILAKSYHRNTYQLIETG
jgi:signal peptidase